MLLLGAHMVQTALYVQRWDSIILYRGTSAVVWYLGPGINEIQGSDCILVLFFECLSQKKNKA